MQRPTQKEIELAMKRLYDAMIAMSRASKAEDNAKLEKQKARFELTLAREEVRALNYDLNI